MKKTCWTCKWLSAKIRPLGCDLGCRPPHYRVWQPAPDGCLVVYEEEAA